MKFKKLKPTVLALLIGSATAYSSFSYASVVRQDVDYQNFRNFGENKGAFYVGATNIPVYDENGTYLGTALPTDVPMPDFQSVETNRYLAGLVDYQYLSSVKHNSDLHFNGTKFGYNRAGSGVDNFIYKMVARHDHSDLDYNTPRLHKMVTEVAHAELPAESTLENLLNTSKYSAFARVGTGTQAVQGNNTVTIIQNAYVYPTGGSSLKLESGKGDLVSTVRGNVQNPNTGYGPLITYGAKGDSGSPLFGYDKELKRWIMVGNVVHYYGYNFVRNNYMLVGNNFLTQNKQNDTGAIFNVKSSKPITWLDHSNGTSTITSELSSLDVDVANGSDLNHGKDIIFKSGTPNLILSNNINQGAGGLYFFTSGTVSGQNDDITHVGSGVYVDNGKTVTWKVKNPSNDRLSKVGAGHLIINGKGTNTGSISVGEGTVTLNQQADSKGNKQAFSTVSLASGRGTVILGSADQLKSTDNIQFANRGGHLDVNGFDLTFSKIRHTDQGANILNQNTHKTSTITLTGNNEFLGDFGLSNTSNNNVNNAVLSKRIAEQSQGTNIANNLNQQGVLNILHTDNSTYVLSGNTDITGNITVENGVLTYQGAPVIFADNYSTGRAISVTSDTDWNNRYVTANQFNAKNGGTLNFGRNLAEVNGQFNVDRATLNLGAKNDLSATILSAIPQTTVNGNVNLKNSSQFNLGKAHLIGAVYADNASNINLTSNAKWTLTGDSTIGNLALENGSTINLNPDNTFDNFNKLTVNGNLSGQGLFRFSTDLANLVGNKLVLNGKASGTHTISIQDSGNEPDFNKLNSSTYTLIEMKQANQPATFTLEKGYVDAGAYRYQLKNLSLTSPTLEQKIADRKAGKTNNLTDVVQPPLDPNYKTPDFTKIDPVFTDETVDKKVNQIQQDYVAKTGGTKVMTFEEMMQSLKDAELISVDLDGNGNAIATLKNGSTYELNNLTTAQANELKSQSNGIDLSNTTADSLTDHTTVVTKEETTLYDTDGAVADGLKVVNGKIVSDTDTNNDTATTTDSFDPIEQGATFTQVQGSQKDVMSKYANSAVNAATNTIHGLTSADQSLNQKLIDLKGGDVWVTYSQNKAKSKSEYYRNNSETNRLTQIGVSVQPSPHTILGVAMTAHQNQSDMDGVNFKHRLTMAEVILRHKINDNVYILGQIGAGRNKQQYRIDGVKSTAHQNVVKAGMMLGANAPVGNFTFSPYAGLRYYRISGGDVNLNHAIVENRTQNQVFNIVGVKATYSADISDWLKISPFISAEYHSAMNEKQVKVNNHSFDYKFHRGVKAATGVSFSTQKASLSVQGETEQSKGYKSNKGLTANLQVWF